MRTVPKTVRAVMAAVAVLVLVRPAAAQSPEEFYRGKTVNIIVGFSVGGGYDLYARLLARHIGRHIPGSPVIVVQNMPGAGSQKAIEYTLSVAAKDGLTMATFGRGLMLAPLLEGAKYDVSKLEWAGSMATDSVVCIAWHASPIKSWADLRTKPSIGGTLGRGSDPEIYSTMIRNLFAPGLKIVTGYPGTADAALAMERGEVDVMCGYSWSTLRASRPHWFAEKKVTLLVQAAPTAVPELAGLPILTEQAANQEQRDVLSILLSTLPMARPYAMPPGTSKERLAAMRTAFLAAMKDPELLKDAKSGGLDIDFIDGEAMAAMLAKVYAMPPETVRQAARVVGN